jgi:hypothetical protein
VLTAKSCVIVFIRTCSFDECRTFLSNLICATQFWIPDKYQPSYLLFVFIIESILIPYSLYMVFLYFFWAKVFLFFQFSSCMLFYNFWQYYYSLVLSMSMVFKCVFDSAVTNLIMNELILWNWSSLNELNVNLCNDISVNLCWTIILSVKIAFEVKSYIS